MRRLRKASGGRAAEIGVPLARTDELIVEEAEEELLIYDDRTAAAHCLSGPAAAVWRECDGQTSATRIAAKLGLDRETVSLALAQLEQCELLEVPRLEGMTRRDATFKLAKVGAAAAFAGPLIYSIAAPTPALAATEGFCLSHPCGVDCQTCVAAGCCCCFPQLDEYRFCVADCSTTNCNETILIDKCHATCPNRVCGC